MIIIASGTYPLYKGHMKKLLLSLSFILVMSSTSHAQTISSVPNSGIVILNAYMPIFLARLNLLEDGKFKTLEGQHRCVYLNNYLATGEWGAKEHDLHLSKVMCGLNPSDVVEVGGTITPEEKNLAESLISSAIAHWPAIGSSSVDGFRQNWLVRDGSLMDRGDEYDLNVQKRAYDILLSRSPFSYSIIKFPWMTKLIYVTWPQ